MPFVSPPSLHPRRPRLDRSVESRVRALLAVSSSTGGEHPGHSRCTAAGRGAVPLSHRAGGTAQRCTPRWSRPSRDFLAAPGRGLELAVKDDGAVTIARMSLTGTSQPWQLPRRTAGYGSKADAGAQPPERERASLSLIRRSSGCAHRGGHCRGYGCATRAGLPAVDRAGGEGCRGAGHPSGMSKRFDRAAEPVRAPHTTGWRTGLFPCVAPSRWHTRQPCRVMF